MSEEDRTEDKKERVVERKKEKKGGVNKKGWVKFLPTIVALGLALFFYFQWQSAEKNNPEIVQQKAEQELVQMVEKVGRLVMLPEGEDPILMTIEDESGLDKSKEFFERAKNGDKILIYKEAKKAYLYRPSEDKLVSVAPVSIGSQTSEEDDENKETGNEEGGEEAKIEQEFEVVIRNGSTTPGLTGKFSEILTAEFSNLKVIEMGDAGNDAYNESVIIVSNEEAEEMSKQLEEKFDLKRLELPEWEEPGGDILVILGEDKKSLTD